MHSSIFKAMARAALRGKWQKTAWIIFVGTLISGGIQLNANEMKPTFQVNLSALDLGGNALTILLVAACVCLFLALMVGSVVNVGFYNLSGKLLAGEEPRMKMLFPRKVVWRAVLMNLLRALLTFGALIIAIVASVFVQNVQIMAAKAYDLIGEAVK